MAAAIVLLIATVTGYAVYDSAARGLKDEVRSNLLATAKSAALLTDGDGLQQVARPEDKHNAVYEQVRKPHLDLVRANENIAFIYTMKQVDGRIFFLTDAKLLKPGDKDDTSDVMEEYVDGTDMLKQGFAERRALVEEEAYTDEWGTFLSGYAPLHDSQGRFIGMIGADIRLTDYLARLAAIRQSLYTGLGIAVVASLLAGVAVWYVRRAAMAADARRQAQEADYAARELARQQEAAQLQADAAEQRRSELHGMADRLDLSVQGVMAHVEQSIRTMREDARSVTRIAEDTIVQSERVNLAARETAELSASVSTAAQQLTGSIAEISLQSEHSRRLADEAAERAGKARGAISALSDWSHKVGEVTDLISDIAFQINMLALNASIEAARAGDAGRGFAVVANEVKNLAQRVDVATSEIESQIREMQDTAQLSVTNVLSISEAIQSVSGNIQTVASAVEQQSAVTGEIARDIQRAAHGARDICSTIAIVGEGARQTSQSAAIVLDTSDQLSSQSGVLKDNVDHFLATVRAA